MNGTTRNLEPVRNGSYPANVERWAIIVGISKYKDESLNLKYADRDAEELYKLLLSPVGGGFEEDHIKKLINEKATTAEVQRALRSYVKKAGKDDIFMLYFACHGSPDLERPKNIYLLTHDTDPNDISGTALPMREIDQSLNENLNAERVVIIADTCHSAAIGGGIGRGSACNSTQAINLYLQEVSKAKGGVALLTSAEKFESSLEGEQWGGGHGVFTHFLLQGMLGDADGYGQQKDGIVTVGELFEYVRAKVREATENKQHPTLGTDFDRSLPMAVCGKIMNSLHDEKEFEKIQGLEFLPLHKLGAREDKQSFNVINFGLFLPGVSQEEGFSLQVRILHEKDFLQNIPPTDFYMQHSVDPEFGDYWSASINIESRDKSKPYSAWGTPGKYVYRYCLESIDRRDPIDWIIDPFAREFGEDKLSAFILGYEPYEWSENERIWKTPSLNDIILYELMIKEFADDIDGTIDRLGYLADLGINCIELMPLSKCGKKVDWGYMPAGYFGVDDRFGNRKDMQRLVNAAHQKGIAVIVDSVYGHTGSLFPYYYVYNELGWPMDKNPFMGPFADNSFGISTDFNQKFTRDFFLTVNHYWLDTYHIDGFRYDYVPGYWLENSENGYTKLVQDTYQLVKAKMGSSDHWQRFFKEDSLNIIQCAEQLRDPIEILNKTYSNCTWQNETLSAAMGVARNIDQLTNLGFFFGLCGYPEEVQHNGDKIMKTALQYLENHDHSRFICNFGTIARDNELLKEGDRSLWYKMQPYLIGLFTARGIPMMWQGQEFGENYCLPQEGWGRILMYRPVHWEYLNTSEGRSLFQLVRKLINLRKNNLQFTRGKYHFYDDYDLYQSRNIILFSKLYKGLFSLVALNFGSQDQVVPFKFQFSGNYREELHGMENLMDILAGREVQFKIPGNYGRIWTLET